MRFKLEKMNTYPKNRAINSIFVMLMSQAYSGTVKRRYSSLRLSMLSHPLNYMYFLYILTFITENKKKRLMPLLFVLLPV